MAEHQLAFDFSAPADDRDHLNDAAPFVRPVDHVHNKDLVKAKRAIRRELRSPVDKLAERESLTAYWKRWFPIWQPELAHCAWFTSCHVGTFLVGNFRRLSLIGDRRNG